MHRLIELLIEVDISIYVFKQLTTKCSHHKKQTVLKSRISEKAFEVKSFSCRILYIGNIWYATLVHGNRVILQVFLAMIQWLSNVFKAIRTHFSSEILLRTLVDKQNKRELLRIKTNFGLKSLAAYVLLCLCNPQTTPRHQVKETLRFCRA